MIAHKTLENCFIFFEVGINNLRVLKTTQRMLLDHFIKAYTKIIKILLIDLNVVFENTFINLR